MLSFLPRRWLQNALLMQWARTLPHDERVRLYYWGTTGNSAHHEFQWADKLPDPPDTSHIWVWA
jgi:hypothetical protein